MNRFAFIATLLFFILILSEVWAFSQNNIVKADSLMTLRDSSFLDRSDSLINRIKSFSNEMLLDSLMIIVNKLSNENADTNLKAFDRCIDYFKSVAKDTTLAHLEYAKSHLYMRLSRYPEALVGFNKSLEMYENILLNHQVGMCYFNMAWIHQKQGNFDRFLAYAKLAARFYKDLPESDKTCLVIMTLAIAYHSTDSLEQSLHYLFEYNKMAKRIKDVNHMAQALGKLGTFYWNAKVEAPLDSARKYFKMEWQIAQKDSSGRALLMAGIDMGSVEKKSKNYDRALYYFDVALNKAEQNRRIYEKQWIMQTIAETYALAGKYDKAYETFRSHTHLKDSIFSEEKNLQVTALEKKYEAEKKDKQIALLAKEKEIQAKETQRQSTLKKAFIGGFIMVALLAGLVIFIINQRFRNQKIMSVKNNELRDANFKSQLSELKIKALHAQINPHFIFNCMNSINEMILNGENENASRYLSKFSQLVRLVLENSENAEVSLQDEIAMLEAYIQLEELRFSGRIKYSFEIKDEIDLENTFLPSMVLQPFVENAIWYGLMPKEAHDDGAITITMKQDNGSLICLIEDNGVGREKAMELQKKTVWKKKSLGLKITEERLRLISKELKQQFIHITDLKDPAGTALGTRVEVNIPIL